MNPDFSIARLARINRMGLNGIYEYKLWLREDIVTEMELVRMRVLSKGMKLITDGESKNKMKHDLHEFMERVAKQYGMSEEVGNAFYEAYTQQEMPAWSHDHAWDLDKNVISMAVIQNYSPTRKASVVLYLQGAM